MRKRLKIDARGFAETKKELGSGYVDVTVEEYEPTVSEQEQIARDKQEHENYLLREAEREKREAAWEEVRQRLIDEELTRGGV